MEWFDLLLIIVGLGLFETVSSVDNAIINAEVLATMGQRARRWFLVWGMLWAVVVVRGVLPWLIVWLTAPSLGPIGALTATFRSDPAVTAAVEASTPILLAGGGTFLLFLFCHWLFLENQRFALPHESVLARYGVWFYAVVSILLTAIVWSALKVNPLMALGAVIGSTTYFITHGFKENAAEQERRLISGDLSDWSKVFYLEAIDATFSIDGVLGAFAFTRSVPLILLGNGIGAFVVRQLTIGNIERVKRYVYLKHGAMYSVFFLGLIMVAEAFGAHVPVWLSPLLTIATIGYFFARSVRYLRQHPARST